MVGQRRRRLRILLLEEFIRPGRRLVDRHVAEPRVHIGHLDQDTSLTAAQTSKTSNTYAIFNGFEHLRVEIRASIRGADRNVLWQVHRVECRDGIADVHDQHLPALVSNSAVRVCRSIRVQVTKCYEYQYIVRIRDKCHSLEHPLITHGDARNVVRAVRFDRVRDQVALARVRRPPVCRDRIVAQVNGKIHFRLLNRFELRTYQHVPKRWAINLTTRAD